MDLLRGNFEVSLKAEKSEEGEREAFRKKAIESISGSMVFVEDEMLYWDIKDE